MLIKTIIENNTTKDYKTAHGVSYYIETPKHKILFDVGPNKKGLLLTNSNKLNIDLKEIDTVIISHGHFDHGGGLDEFLKVNNQAKIYIQEPSFNDYYSKVLFFKIYIGLNKKLKQHQQIILLNGDYEIDEELSLITSKSLILPSPMNKALLKTNNTEDDFIHEQSLLLKDHINNKKILFTGCSHCGIINILDKVLLNNQIDVQIGGFHLYNPVNKKSVSDEYLNEFINKLKEYPITYYTNHCTGNYCFNKISQKINKVYNLNAGDVLKGDELYK